MVAGFWSLLVFFLALFYSSSLRSSLVLQQFEPNVDTLEDAAKFLPKVYVPMFPGYGSYLEIYENILGPEVYKKVKKQN